MKIHSFGDDFSKKKVYAKYVDLPKRDCYRNNNFHWTTRAKIDYFHKPYISKCEIFKTDFHLFSLEKKNVIPFE